MSRGLPGLPQRQEARGDGADPARAPARGRGPRPRRRDGVRRAGRGPADLRGQRAAQGPRRAGGHRAAHAGRRLRPLRRRAQRHARRALRALGRPAEVRRRATTSCCSPSSPTSPTSAAAPTSPARSPSATPTAVELVVEGRMDGRVIRETRGSGGFGYDVVFVADDHPGPTTAELSVADKDAISHRGRALREIAPQVAVLLGSRARRRSGHGPDRASPHPACRGSVPRRVAHAEDGPTVPHPPSGWAAPHTSNSGPRSDDAPGPRTARAEPACRTPPHGDLAGPRHRSRTRRQEVSRGRGPRPRFEAGTTSKSGWGGVTQRMPRGTGRHDGRGRPRGSARTGEQQPADAARVGAARAGVVPRWVTPGPPAAAAGRP